MEPAAVSPGSSPILVTRDLTKSFRRLTALKNHSVEVKRGEILGVIGPNGSGKSTFFNVVTGFQKPNAGTVRFEGREIQHLSAPNIVRLGVARTFQGTRLFPRLSVRENLRAAAQLRHPLGFADAVFGLPRLGRVNRAVEQLTDEMLALINLRARADDRAADLPYGDQRRLELARALATRPRLLMLDEPAAGMNAAETQSLLRLIDDIRKRYELAVIVVEHDMDLIMNLCDRIQVLAHGEIIFEGTPPEVQANPRVREVYLGQA
ncbi:MAG TPA: ABC transporter ATP-binding protein [Dongiaceae bacterium]|jgi:branched-chain amino acid transport system ATP-binding protein|nr:ABC transporter ATP-binding protein [Dongiaceae bacterium]